MRLAKVLGTIGRVCITAGALILLFVGYQLWGTGLREAQAQDKLESEFEERLRSWKVRSPVLKLNAALSELPRWTATGGETWPVAGTVNCRESLDDAQAAFEAAERGELSVGFTEIYSQTASDPTGAPPGGHVISVFGQYAPADAGREAWDAGLREAAADQVFGLIERFAPGFRDTVLARPLQGPADLERGDPNLVGGDVGGGSYALDQTIFRPLPALVPYATPIRGLWLGSSSAFPGGAVHGVPGWAPASYALAARRLGR